MNNYHSPTFGTINLDAVEARYETTKEWEGKLINLDLNIIADKSIDRKLVTSVDDFIENLIEHEKVLRQGLEDALKKGETTKEYIDFHLEELDEDEIEILLEKADKSQNIEDQFFSALYLKRIGFYPEKGDERLAVFDYTISEELTDELLVVKVGKDLDYYITMES